MAEHFDRSRRAALLGLLPLAACAGGDRGIGGTGGIADRGIGGTGIVGTVTGFGSIWVNGLRVALPDRLPVTLEGQPTGPDSLRVGQVAAMLTRPGPAGGLVAETLDLRLAVAGPLERIAPGALGIFGQRIDLARLRIEGLALGQWLGIAGLRQPDGSILATRIERWPAERGWLLRGTLDSASPGRAVVAGQAITCDLSLPAPGAALRLTGRLAGTVAIAEVVAADPINPFGARVAALSIETYLDARGRPPGLGGALAGTPGARVVYEARVVGPGGALLPGSIAPAPGLGDRAPPGGPRGTGGPPGGPGLGPGGAPPGGGGLGGGGHGGGRR